MQRVCSNHGKEILFACLYEGCNSYFLCQLCHRVHPGEHEEHIKAISELCQDQSWITICEEQRVVGLEKASGVWRKKDEMLDSQREGLQILIQWITNIMEEKYKNFQDEAMKLTDLEQDDRMLKLGELIQHLERLDFGTGDVFDLIVKVQNFHTKDKPKMHEIYNGAKNALEDKKIDQEKINSYKDALIRSLGNVTLTRSLPSNKADFATILSLASIQQQNESLQNQLNHFKSLIRDKKSSTCREISSEMGQYGLMSSIYYCKGKKNGCLNAVGNVWGSNPYHPDSNICMAALHAGVVGLCGGFFNLQICTIMTPENGSYQNGIQSESFLKVDINSKGFLLS